MIGFYDVAIALNMEADECALVEVGLRELNDWRSPTYVSGKSSYKNLIKHYKVKTLKKKIIIM